MSNFADKCNRSEQGRISSLATYLALALLISVAAFPARAVVLNTDNGGLNVTSIEGLRFMNMLFDVTFSTDSFNDVFGPGTPAANEPFFSGAQTTAGQFLVAVEAVLNAQNPSPQSAGGRTELLLPYFYDARDWSAVVSRYDPPSGNWSDSSVSSSGCQSVGAPPPSCRVTPFDSFFTQSAWTVVEKTGTVPEPGSALLFGLGAGGLAWARRKRNGKPHLPAAA